VLCALALALVPAATADAAPPRAVVAFLPVRPAHGATERTLERLQRRPGLALGLLSASQGQYAAEQVLLDITQGARVSLAAYSPEEPPPLQLAVLPGDRGFLRGWSDVLLRADKAPGDVRPGLLAASIPGGAAYAGVQHRPHGVAIAAADDAGEVEEVSLGPSKTLAARTQVLLGDHRLVVVGLPTGRKGGAALDRLLRARARTDLVFVVRAPPAAGVAQLLPIGAAGLGPGVLRSSTTRQDGVVASIDLAPTILKRLGLRVPADMKGEPMTSVPGQGVSDLVDLYSRLRVVSGRRLPALEALLVGWVALLLLAGTIAGPAGFRRAARIGGLAVLWLPSVLLLTAALAPSRTAEQLIVACGCLLLGALTDLAVPWPRGPLVPAAVGVVAYTVDLAFGSDLIVRSLLGPNPRFGSRFYGIGNELEAILPILLFLGLAALPWTRQRSVRGAAIFAVAGAALALIIGAGRLGADVGGVVTVGAGTAAATLLMLPGGVTRKAVAIAICVPIAALVVLAVVDLVSGGNSHFTRSILEASSAGSVEETLGRRYELAFNALKRGLMPVLTALALLAIAYAVRWRSTLYAPVADRAGWRAALVGGVVAAVVGSLVNDSGPILLVFGVVVLALATAYIQGAPRVPR
jgi:hypothetical protein